MSDLQRDNISNLKTVKLESSIYIKPLRLEYEINGIKKKWDLIQMHDDVGVFIYNRDRKVVILVKQFRPAMYAAQLENLKEGLTIEPNELPFSKGYTIELCAGIVDKKISLAEVAREEVLEECGYDVPVNSLKKLFSFRSVGVSGNTTNLYYVEVNDKQKKNSGGGLEADGEFIEVVEMTLPEFRSYIDSVDLRSPASLAVAAMWFFANITP